MADVRNIGELIEALADMLSPSAQEAIRKLQEIGHEAVPPLIEALNNENPNIAAQAALLLGTLKDREVIPHLLRAAKDDRSMVAHWAIMSLGRLGDETVVDTLVAALKEPKTRLGAADALGYLKAERAVGPLIELLYADAEEILASELEIEEPEYSEHYKRADFFSRSIIYALVEIGDSKVIEPLIEALTSSDDRVGGAAIEGLRAIGLPAVEPLIRAFPKVRKLDGGDWVITLLGEIGDNQAFDVIMDALGDSYSPMRSVAAHALANLKDKRAIPRLIELLSDDNEWVRKSAREALLKLGYELDKQS